MSRSREEHKQPMSRSREEHKHRRAVSDADNDRVEIEKWDPEFTERVIGILRPLIRRYFRTQVRGLENIPPAGGALLVSNHSGGQFAADVPILAVEFYEKFGYDRPIHTLSHDMLFAGPIGDVLRRTGYVRTAIEAGVPIVPAVSIGGQENQLYLTRGSGLAKRLGPIARAARTKIVPISFGFPFGLSVAGMIPPNFPLPTKIVTQVLEPIDIVAEFGENPDIAAVDAHVREVMQSALDRLGRERRLPILG
jgi:1-acyl-sn-glycerol-3-phosphate acyltransferase